MSSSLTGIRSSAFSDPDTISPIFILISCKKCTPLYCSRCKIYEFDLEHIPFYTRYKVQRFALIEAISACSKTEEYLSGRNTFTRFKLFALILS
jgi:hypothetical protein